MSRRTSAALFAVGFLVASLVTPCAATEVIKSQHFEFEGACRGGGRDMVYTWNGGANVIPPPTERGKSFIYPWTDEDILIRGVELTVVKPWPMFVGWFEVGNNTWPDFMLMLGAGQSHAVNFFPGEAFRFPGRKMASPLAYIDLHGWCTWPFKARVFLEIYYTPDDSQSAPQP